MIVGQVVGGLADCHVEIEDGVIAERRVAERDITIAEVGTPGSGEHCA